MKATLSERWYQFCVFMLKQFYVNLLWVLFTLLGLIIFGIGSATVSMLAVQRQWIRGNKEVKVFSTFIRSFKENFKEATVLGIGYLFIGIVLATNIIGIPNFFARTFFIVIAFFYLISLSYIGPVMVHFDLQGIRPKIKASLILGFSYLQYTLVMFVALAIVCFIVLLHYGLLTFFGAAVGGYVVMRFANTVFVRAENQIVANEDVGMKFSSESLTYEN